MILQNDEAINERRPRNRWHCTERYSFVFIGATNQGSLYGNASAPVLFHFYVKYYNGIRDGQ